MKKLKFPLSREKYLEVKDEIAEKCNEHAKFYNEKMKGNNFLFLAEGKVYTVKMSQGNFKHLCGIDSWKKPWEFYNLAIEGNLKARYIKFNDRFPIATAYEKAYALDTIFDALFNDREKVSIYTNLNSETRLYEIAFHIDNKPYGTLCFDRDTKDNSLVPVSVRTRSTQREQKSFALDLKVDYIFMKKFAEEKYTKLNCGDAETLEDYLDFYGIDKDIIKLDKTVINLEEDYEMDI